jgi:cytochrome c peroxidase
VKGLVAIAAGVSILGGCQAPEAARALGVPSPEDVPSAGRALQPLPPPRDVDPRRAALGGKLFAEPLLSSDGAISCATCHPLERAGTDGLSHSRGAGGQVTALNTPTIYNVTYSFRFNWSGAYQTLEDEFDAPVTKTMNTTWEAIDAKLLGHPALRAAFAAAYPDGVTTANVKDALARYIDTLRTPGARFDQYLRGDPDALNAQELRGYERFSELGCAACHQGANVGGNLFQRFGVMNDYFQLRRERGGADPTAADFGKYNTTRDPADRYVFRVPSLRNVARTAPYFHDGSAATLEQAVETMGDTQLGLTLSTDEIGDLTAFLETLTGTVGGDRP